MALARPLWRVARAAEVFAGEIQRVAYSLRMEAEAAMVQRRAARAASKDSRQAKARLKDAL